MKVSELGTPNVDTSVLTRVMCQLAETDLDTCRWALDNLYDLETYLELINKVMEFATQKLIDLGFIPGRDFSANPAGGIFINRRIMAALMEEATAFERLLWEEILQVLNWAPARSPPLGYSLNSAAVIIGAMIVALLMLPIRELAFAALEGNAVLLRLGLIAIVVGTLLAVILAWLLDSLVGLPEFGSEVVARSKPTLLDLGIAVAAGGISGFAKVEVSQVEEVRRENDEQFSEATE